MALSSIALASGSGANSSAAASSCACVHRNRAEPLKQHIRRWVTAGVEYQRFVEVRLNIELHSLHSIFAGTHAGILLLLFSGFCPHPHTNFVEKHHDIRETEVLYYYQTLNVAHPMSDG